MLRFISSLALAGLLSGCAAVTPLTSALTGAAPASGLDIRTQTEVKIDSGNFVLVRTNLTGTSKGFSLLGFIPIYPATLDKAMGRLYSQAGAQPGSSETLAHLMVEHSAVYLILFSIPRVTARADLIEFLPSNDEDNDSAKPLGPFPVRRKSAHRL